MKTQSPDTSLEAELVLIGMVRKAPVSKRFTFVQSWAASLLEAGCQYMQQLYPQASDEEARLLFIERQYGKDLTDELRQALQVQSVRVAAPPNYWETIRSLAQIFEDLHLPYALSGSLASSLYGLQRATLQIGFVVDLCERHLLSLCRHLESRYWLQREGMEVAIQQQTCFPLVHLESLLKVIVTLPGKLVLGQQWSHSVRKLFLVEAGPPLPVLSPEQMILSLLNAFKRSNQRADDLWYDLLGIAKVQDSDLNIPLLERHAAALEMTELLIRALVDAGLREVEW